MTEILKMDDSLPILLFKKNKIPFPIQKQKHEIIKNIILIAVSCDDDKLQQKNCGCHRFGSCSN